MPHQFITDETFREIFRKANVANMTAQQVEDFIRQNKYHWNHMISLDVKYKEVHEKGMALGREEEKISTAKKLKAHGTDITLIHDVT